MVKETEMIKNVELSKSKSSEKVYFFDSLRVLAMLCIIIYHAVASYSTVVPFWGGPQDATDVSADIVRFIFDVFVIPTFFFIAGYFGLKSLQRHGSKKFLESKFKRLMTYWIFIVLIILPFLYWQMNEYSVEFDSYWQYWVIYIFSIGIITIGPQSASKVPGPAYAYHFWYISILFYFFVVFWLIYMVKEKNFKTSNNPGISEQPSTKSIAKILLLFGIFSSIAYFIMLLIVADIYWVNINHIAQFQPTDLVIYICYFGLGIYASSRNWFTNGEAPGRIELWGSLCVVLSIAFLIVGEDIFTNPNSPELNPGILITFAFIRSFLCLSVVFLLLSITIKFLNKPNPIIKDFSRQSYHIYLIHMFVVVIFQMALVNWSEGPVLVKILIVVISSLFISFLISKYVGEKFPKPIVIIIFVMFFILPILAQFFPILNEF